MGAGASALGERVGKERALKVGARYGFTSAMFDELQQDGTISIKQLIDSVKKHQDLAHFDTNKDGKIDGKEINGLVKVLTGSLSEKIMASKAASAGKSKSAPVNFKTALAGKVRKADYLSHYMPLTELGSGMSGTVFSVQNVRSGASYACKSVRKRGLKEVDLENLRGEVALLSQLDHPNIVKIIEAFEDETHVTIIMELCHGGELYDSLITAEFYTEDVARNIFRQIVHAITYCHNQVRVYTYCHSFLDCVCVCVCGFSRDLVGFLSFCTFNNTTLAPISSSPLTSCVVSAFALSDSLACASRTCVTVI